MISPSKSVNPMGSLYARRVFFLLQKREKARLCEVCLMRLVFVLGLRHFGLSNHLKQLFSFAMPSVGDEGIGVTLCSLTWR